jgi:hypothetical protein
MPKMNKELIEKVKKQLLNEKTTKLGWTLPKWVAVELFEHIEQLENQVEHLKKKLIGKMIEDYAENTKVVEKDEE